MEKLKRGISLIVLVITIIVMIILAASIMLALTSTNTMEKATEAAFKNTSKSYLEEYNAWISEQKLNTNGIFDISEVNSSKDLSYNGKYIQDIIKNIKKEDIEKYEIVRGNLIYKGTENETKWAKEVGFKEVEKAKGEEDTIVFTDTKVDSVYDKLKIYGSSENGVAGLNKISLTVTQNLIDNGFGEYKDGTNFSSYVVNIPNEKVKGGVSCFYADYKGTTTNCKSLSYIPIDTNKKYTISMYIKSNVIDTLMYSGILEYDVDHLIIKSDKILYVNNTLTYLTQDLKNGDAVVHLADASNFEVPTTIYKQGFIFWNYKDSTGHLYEPLTYSQNIWIDLYTAENIDRENNTITLKTAWNKGTVKAGTKLSQSYAGATYNYSLYNSQTKNTEWEYRHSSIKGVKTGAAVYTMFRPGTKYISWLLFPNYTSVEGGGAKVANIIFAESDKYNKIYTIDMTGHEPLRTMEDGTSDYIDFKTKKIVRNVGINNGTMYKLSSVTYENISLPDIPIYEGNTAITLNQTGRLEGTYIK